MMMLSQAATVLNGTLQGEDALFRAVSKDTRTIERGDLYVALIGEHFDGHRFVAQAGEAGAAGALVSQYQPVSLPQVHVKDTRLALGELAASWRQQFAGRVIGITGSNGKTTVKEMCRSIFASAAGNDHVLSTRGNLNNDIGMPMTLLSIRERHRYAVIEMGANHVGEIEYLTAIARPDVAVITNAGPAHLEGFGSVRQVAEAKAEIYGGLGENGIAVINRDDTYAGYWREVCAPRQTMCFSMRDAGADVYAEVSEGGFLLHAPVGQARVRLSVPGAHNVMNALAAASAALAAGVRLEHVVAGLEAFSGVPGRLAMRRAHKGARVIDDSYNANPQSLSVALEVLVEQAGRPWLVLGDMAELGADAKELHADAGRQAKKLGVERLFAVGAASAAAVDSFGEGAESFENRQALVDAVMNAMGSDSVILVKGSRASAMDEVVAALIDEAVAGEVAVDEAAPANKNNKPGVN